MYYNFFDSLGRPFYIYMRKRETPAYGSAAYESLYTSVLLPWRALHFHKNSGHVVF